MLRPLLLIIGVGKTKVKVTMKALTKQEIANKLGCSAEQMDRNDCAVIALSATTGKSYEECYDICKEEMSRKDGNGVLSCLWEDWLQQNGFKQVDVSEYTRKYSKGGPARRPRIRSLMKRLPKGRYIYNVAGHTGALVDGAIIDWATDKIVKKLFKYEPES